MSQKTDNKPKKRERKRFSARGAEIKRKRTMRFWFSSIVWVLFAITGVTTALIFFVLYGILSTTAVTFNVFLLIAAMTLSSILIGFILAAIAPRIVFKRITKISDGMMEIARGNFKARVPERDKEDAISEFGELERTFNRMAAELDGIEIFRNDFINNFSHEFKTPIVSLRGFARQLQSDNLTAEQRKEYIGIIVSESERLAKMATNVLLLSKLENQQLVSEKTEFYLDEQIRGCILLFEKEWSDKNLDLDIELDAVKYTFNEEMLSHVWVNLFSNAIKFTPENGRITCRLNSDGKNIIFTVSDTGIGMTQETKNRIFEKFYQGDSSHAISGNGIGLNIVYRVITLADGEISVESEINRGTTFKVKLPISQIQ